MLRAILSNTRKQDNGCVQNGGAVVTAVTALTAGKHQGFAVRLRFTLEERRELKSGLML